MAVTVLDHQASDLATLLAIKIAHQTFNRASVVQYVRPTAIRIPLVPANGVAREDIKEFSVHDQQE